MGNQVPVFLVFLGGVGGLVPNWVTSVPISSGPPARLIAAQVVDAVSVAPQRPKLTLTVALLPLVIFAVLEQ